mmetsp:Transcript_25303/g.84521  ORF Transcript_25303/g.84521 Transcript_25303/m.84521 type:complete len:296 (+) Transcript_25303:468-1355(+)
MSQGLPSSDPDSQSLPRSAAARAMARQSCSLNPFTKGCAPQLPASERLPKRASSPVPAAGGRLSEGNVLKSNSAHLRTGARGGFAGSGRRCNAAADEGPQSAKRSGGVATRTRPSSTPLLPKNAPDSSAYLGSRLPNWYWKEDWSGAPTSSSTSIAKTNASAPSSASSSAPHPSASTGIRPGDIDTAALMAATSVSLAPANLKSPAPSAPVEPHQKVSSVQAAARGNCGNRGGDGGAETKLNFGPRGGDRKEEDSHATRTSAADSRTAIKLCCGMSEWMSWRTARSNALGPSKSP